MIRITAIGDDIEAIDYYLRLLEEAVRGRAIDDYYRGEDAGVWMGAAARFFGLEGKRIERKHIERIFKGCHPLTGEKLISRTRKTVAYDITISAPKSLSTLAALKGGDVEDAIVAAHDAAVREVVQYIERHTTTRAGHNGVITVETTGLTAGAVRHRTSRTMDPQLHTHVLAANMVQGIDGQWRTVDARTWYRGQRMYGAIYRAALRRELAARLPGLQWAYHRGDTAEVQGMAAINQAFSSRAKAAELRCEQLLEAWQKEHPDQTAGPVVRGRLMRRAVLETRPKKGPTRDMEELRAHWLEVATEKNLDLEALDLALAGRAGAEELGQPREQIMVEVVNALADRASTWSKADVLREVAVRLGAHSDPQYAGTEGAVAEVEEITDTILRERCVDIADPADRGRFGLNPTIPRYTSTEIVREERYVRSWIDVRSPEESRPLALGKAQEGLRRHLAAGGKPPNPRQLDAARLIAGGDRMAAVVGPAGTGKTTTLRLAAAMAAEQHIIVLTPSARAGEVAHYETGLPAENAPRWVAAVINGWHLDPGLEPTHGMTIVVDEAGMVNTPTWAALMELADRYEARIVAVGDHRQLAPVGRGGVFERILAHAPTVELDSPHRFADPWEAQATLKLRDGDTAVAQEYAARDRVHTGVGSQAAAKMLAAWWRSWLAGEDGVWMADRLEDAQELSVQAQELRRVAGELGETYLTSQRAAQRIYVGDRVQIRSNERRAEAVSAPVRNREMADVVAIRHDHVMLHVRESGQLVRVDRTWAERHMELGYVRTVHAVQGATADVGGVLLSQYASHRAAHVGLTRGRLRNEAWIAVDDPGTSAAEALAEALDRDRPDLGVAHQIEHLRRIAQAEREAEAELEAQRERRTLRFSGRRRDDADDPFSLGF